MRRCRDGHRQGRSRARQPPPRRLRRGPSGLGYPAAQPARSLLSEGSRANKVSMTFVAGEFGRRGAGRGLAIVPDLDARPERLRPASQASATLPPPAFLDRPSPRQVGRRDTGTKTRTAWIAWVDDQVWADQRRLRVKVARSFDVLGGASASGSRASRRGRLRQADARSQVRRRRASARRARRLGFAAASRSSGRAIDPGRAGQGRRPRASLAPGRGSLGPVDQERDLARSKADQRGVGIELRGAGAPHSSSQSGPGVSTNGGEATPRPIRSVS